MVLSPFSKKFWTEFYGDVFGSRAKQTWKRAGAEIMKTVTFDIDHWKHEFNGDLDAAYADLDNYSIEEFGIDLALLAATIVAPAALGAAGSLAAKTTAGAALSRVAGKAAAAAGRTAAAGSEMLMTRINNAKTLLALFSSGRLTGAAARPYTRIAVDIFEEAAEKGSILVGDEQIAVADRNYMQRVLNTYKSGLEAGTEEEALDLATSSLGRMQENIAAEARAAESKAAAERVQKQELHVLGRG